MIGFSLAILANFFWALVNIIDKYLVSRFCKDGSVGSILILSSLFPIILIPLSYFLSDHSEILTSLQIGILILSGALTTCWMYFYFSALFSDDVSTVIPLFQLVPVFALMFGFLILGEIPLLIQLGSAGIVLVGSVILSLEQTTGKVKLKLLMQLAASSSIIALMNVLFKYAAIDTDFWLSIMWQSVGTVFGGLTLFLLHKKYRIEFMTFIQENYGIGITLNALNETLALVGNVSFAYAILLAPIALIQTMGAYQPVFVLIIGLFVARFFPLWVGENTTRYALVQKTMGITLVIIGSVLLIVVGS